MNRDWPAVDTAVSASVAQRPDEYDPATLAVMSDLLAFLRSTGRAAPDVSPGYWPTFCLSFNAPGAENLALEVFGDRVEVYRFHDGRSDIWYEMHEPGGDFSAAFADEIPIANPN